MKDIVNSSKDSFGTKNLPNASMFRCTHLYTCISFSRKSLGPAQEPILTVNLDNGVCGSIRQRTMLGVGAPLKKKTVAMVGGEEMEEMPPSSRLPPWSYL